MEYKKVYAAVSIAIGVVLLYALFNLVWGLLQQYSFSSEYLLYFLPVIIGITGLLIFITTGYKKSGLLRLFMCYEVFNFPFVLFYYATLFYNTSSSLGQPSFITSWQFYIGIFFNLLIAAASAIGLWYIGKRRLPKITYFGEGYNKVGQFVPATAGLRFANRVIDGVFISFIMLRSLFSFFSLRHTSSYNSRYDLTDSPLLLYAVTIPAIIIYYLLLEGIFNTTAGKSATNTTIVNEHGDRPGFVKILGRTFCRLIPFEAFSFLGAAARGWHDILPNTYVVESIDVDDVQEYEITLDAETNMQTQ